MIDLEKIDFEKMDGLVPAIVVDNYSNQVLMLGFMNKEAVAKTIELGKVTFLAEPKTDFGQKGKSRAIS